MPAAVILDNYATHKWLLAHPRFHLRFTPASASWLNLVERRFTELTQKKLKRGVHRSVQTLERDIRAWPADWREHPRPFIWTKTANEILDKAASYCHRISDSRHWVPFAAHPAQPDRLHGAKGPAVDRLSLHLETCGAAYCGRSEFLDAGGGDGDAVGLLAPGHEFLGSET